VDPVYLAVLLMFTTLTGLVARIHVTFIVEAPVLTYNVIYSESVELNCTVTYAPDLLNVTWIRATNPVSVVDRCLLHEHVYIQIIYIA
jgi:hypothetical protein